MEIEQEKYPFLILFPYFLMPKTITKDIESECQGAATDKFWIRGASPSFIFDELLEQLVSELGVYSIMPEAKAEVSEFCQMLAKIAYSFAVGELGINAFHPFLIPYIIHTELGDCDKYIGGLGEDEVSSSMLHELSIINTVDNNYVIVRIRLLAKLGTPTYYAVAGTRTN